MPKKNILPQQLVWNMIQIAIAKAEELNIKVSVAIVDDGGNLTGFLKMDGAKLIPSNIAQNKAYTAAGFGIPTSQWYERIKENPPLLHGLVHTDRMTIFGGGCPIYIEGDLVGGIGVSGGTAAQDEQCAKAALLAI